MTNNISRRRVLTGAAALAGSAVVGSVARTPAQATAEPRSTHLDAAFLREFADPGNETRPTTYLFLPELAELTAEGIERSVRAIAQAGLGGVTAFHGDLAPSADQNGLLKAVLEAARRHGISVDLHIDRTASLPVVTAGGGADQQELVYGHASVDGGARFTGRVPAPLTDPARPRTLVAVVAACRVEGGVDDKPVLLELASLVDLTDLAKDDEISWAAPAGGGQWMLFGFWQRGTESPYADYFSTSGTRVWTDHWDRHVFTPEIQELVDAVGRDIVEGSLHLQGYHLWTRDFLPEFERRRGYSLRKYLPLTFIPYVNDFWANLLQAGGALHPDTPADFDVAGDAGRRIRNDYYRTLSELYTEHHLGELNKWARTHGLRHRAKPAYHQTFDISAAAVVDVPTIEDLAMGKQLDAYRAMAGAVHMGRKDRLVFEGVVAATQFGYDLYATTWQQTLNVVHGAYAAGVNRLELHGFAYPDAAGARWPGYWEFQAPAATPYGIGEAYGPRMPYWRHMPDITGLLAREQFVLSHGTPRVDVAIYRHSYWSTPDFIPPNSQPAEGVGVWSKDRTLERHGYSYDFVGPDLFRLPNAVVHDGRLDPQGPAYQALVLHLPEQVRIVRGIPLAAARKILEYARAGLPVVIVGAVAGNTGFFGDQADDLEVRKVLAALQSESVVREVAAERDVLLALTELGVRAAATLPRPSNVVTAHRAGTTADFHYLYNQQGVNGVTGAPEPPPEPFDEVVALAGRGRPYRLDPWTGEITPIATYTQDEDGVSTRVRLAPGESTIVAISRHEIGIHAEASTAEEVVMGANGALRIRDTRQGTYTVRLSDGRTAVSSIGELPDAMSLSHWRLSVEDWRPGEGAADTVKIQHHLRLSALRPWTDISSLEDVSGIGRYATEVDLGAEWIDAGHRGVRLELGPVLDSVRVRINGCDLPAVNVYRPVLDVTRHLDIGRNTVEIEIATTLRNRLRVVTTRPEFADAPRQLHGLTGPVRLVPYGEAEI